MRHRYRSNRGGGGAFEAINVTPLIDVVMCLIIFFLLVGKMAQDRNAGVTLPKSGVGSRTDVPRPVVVSVGPGEPVSAASPGLWGGVSARIVVAGQLVLSDDELASTMREAARRSVREGGGTDADFKNVTVELRADEAVPFGAVEPVLRACQREGLTVMRLAAERVR